MNMKFGEIPNYGIGIAYTPMTELNSGEVEHYCGFLTHKTNTFFEPFTSHVGNSSKLSHSPPILQYKYNLLFLSIIKCERESSI